jgi:Domain of unknown function (DU1801)
MVKRAPAKTSAKDSRDQSVQAADQLDEFLARFTPEVTETAKQALRKMRTRLPGAIELIYDNYNALAIGFSPSDRASDAIFSIALYPRWVSLFFLTNGARLRDPEGRLQGSGKQTRHIVLETAALLDDPAVQELMAQALELSAKQIDASQPRRLIVKSISAKQRPRRPGERSA